ncbi:gastrula zinc finger protein XlCGF7.1-like [Stegodyphus dumicola]|uniref:gastrula zinc finger protein XlCGF7.1-like n=1 Tax=Stegodyphus dumicola TaxID=202533 RepID=UPI0015A7A92D|nr:gastrula zinc finger protein XlCGF7.1-like [Stegodyphus dumicola]
MRPLMSSGSAPTRTGRAVVVVFLNEMKRSAVICNKQTLYPCSGNTMFMPSDPLLLPTSQVGYVDLHVWYIWNRQFNRKGNLNRHLNFHTGVWENVASKTKIYSCSLCSFSSPALWRLNRHKRVHSGERPYGCTVCNKRFSEKGNMKKHLMTHRRFRHIILNIGTFRFAGTDDKVASIVSSEIALCYSHNSFACHRMNSYHCKYLFLIKDMKEFGMTYTCASGSGDSTHLSQSQKYASSSPYICEVCNKPFTQKGNLNRHLKFHTGARPFVCRVCNRGFTLKQNLERHFRVHTGHRPYECKYCGKRFKQDTTLRSHYITHMKSF